MAEDEMVGWYYLLNRHEFGVSSGSWGWTGKPGMRRYPTLKVKKGAGEEIPLVQGKEQWLCFAGAAVKRYPIPKVRETQIRQ